MGDMMGGGLSSLFGGASSGIGGLDPASVLFGGGGTGSGFGAFDGSNIFSNDFGAFDPTGAGSATAAITGTSSGVTSPAGPPDVGGSQSDSGTSANQYVQQNTGTMQPPSPPPVPNTQVPPMVQAADTSRGPFSPSQQQTVPGPSGFQYMTDAQRQAGLQAIQQGQGQPTSGWQAETGGQTPNEVVANRTGEFQPPANQPGANAPPWAASTMDQIKQTGGKSPVYDSDQPTDGDKSPKADDETTPPARGSATAPPATTPPTGAPGQGMPGVGGIGRVIGDLMGVMSGNPQSLGSLVQDIMGMAGGGMPPGMQIPGANTPYMQPNQAQPYTQQGDPSTFGGPGYAGMTPGGRPAPTGAPVAGARGAPPAGVPQGGMAPNTPQPASIQRGQRPPEMPPGGGSATSAPAAAGQMASTPLGRNEIQVPQWSRAAQNAGGPPMRPSQGSVDRRQFKNTSDATIYKLAWMVKGEVGGHAPLRTQIVQAETAMNRAQARGQSLDHVLLDTRSQGGYYDGRSPTPTYRQSAQPTQEEFQRFKEQVWKPLMQGSNLSDVGWGPMTGNASAGVARHQFQNGTDGYTMRNGESYFREGPFRHNFPEVPQQQPQQQPMVASQ